MNVRTVFLLLCISVFLCQSGVCSGLEELFDPSTPPVSACHDSGLKTHHETPEDNSSEQSGSNFEITGCCLKYSLNILTIDFKIFSESNTYSNYIQNINSPDISLRFSFPNEGHPAPSIYSTNTVMLI